MKQVIIVISTVVIVILTTMILSVDINKMDRQDELDRAVSGAAKQTVKDSQISEQTEINSNEDMIAHFVNLLSVNINSDSDLSVEVMGVDYEEGMLDVHVTSEFKYLNGKNGTLSVRKCAIFE